MTRFSPFFVLFLIIFTRVQAQDDHLKKLYDEALAVETKNANAAVKVFSQIIQSDPHSDYSLRAGIRMTARPSPVMLPTVFACVQKICKDNSRADDLFASFLISAGRLYYLEYKSDSALYFYKSAIGLMKSLGGDHSQQMADSYQGLGDIHKYNLYLFDEAESNYEKSLTIQTQIRPVNTAKLARLYYNLATTNRSQQDYVKASSYGLSAVRYLRELNDQPFLERAYSALGSIYRDQQLFDSARRYYQMGININRLVNKGKDNETLAGHFQALAQTYRNEGKFGEAINSYQASVRIFENLKSKDEVLYLHSLQQLAEVQLSANELEAGQRILVKADRLRVSLGYQRGGPASSLFKLWGDYYSKTGKRDLALSAYQKALAVTTDQFDSGDVRMNPTSLEINFNSFAYSALIAKAEELMKEPGNENEALKCFVLAETLITKSRNNLDTDDSKWVYTQAQFDLYEKCLVTIYSKYRQDHDKTLLGLAYYFFERSRARTLAESLDQAEHLESGLLPDSLFLFLRKNRQQQLEVQSRLANHGDDADELGAELLALDQQRRAAEEMISQTYPNYLSAKFARDTSDIDELRSFTKSRDAVAIEYFWGVRNVFALAVAPNDAQFVRLGSPDSLLVPINRLMTGLQEKKNRFNEASVREFAETSFQLYSKLLSPFGKLYGTAKRIIILPDGPVSQVPFEVMIAKLPSADDMSFRSLHYLVLDHVITYAFSCQFALRQHGLHSRDPRLVAFGFTNGASERSSSGSTVQLAGSEYELIALQKKFPEGQFLSGLSVTESNFKSNAGKYDMIHLAVHGKGDPDEKYSASLFFHPDKSKEDGVLHWYELFGLQLHASLAVLSSCESGLGKSYKGEGMLSMASAFAFAGCRNIVQGLWKVDDQMSVTLMDKFYDELLKGQPVDEALSLAKRAYLADADNVMANPRIWGSLVAYGNEKIVEKEKSDKWLYGGIIAIISIAFVAFYLRRSGS